MTDNSPTAPPESRSIIGHYLWDHPTLLPRVARVEDADFARGDPEWVRCYPVEVVIPSASPPEAATLPVVASDENAVRALGIYYQLMPSEAAKLTPSLRERMRGVLLCVGSDAQAALDTLAAEVERLTGELATVRENVKQLLKDRKCGEPVLCGWAGCNEVWRHVLGSRE